MNADFLWFFMDFLPCEEAVRLMMIMRKFGGHSYVQIDYTHFDRLSNIFSKKFVSSSLEMFALEYAKRKDSYSQLRIGIFALKRLSIEP